MGGDRPLLAGIARTWVSAFPRQLWVNRRPCP